MNPDRARAAEGLAIFGSNSMPKLLIVTGIILILVGIIWLVGERFGLGRLPGDIVIERGNFRVYIPVATSLLVSVVLSLAFWLFNR